MDHMQSRLFFLFAKLRDEIENICIDRSERVRQRKRERERERYIYI